MGFKNLGFLIKPKNLKSLGFRFLLFSLKVPGFSVLYSFMSLSLTESVLNFESDSDRMNDRMVISYHTSTLMRLEKGRVIIY